MNFIHNDLGHLGGGEIVEVSLSAAANVRLMDDINFNNYRRGGRHQFFGGQAQRTPYRLSVPHAAHWHVAIDLGGYAGSVRSGVRVLE